MHDVQDGTGSIKLIIHDDEDTPLDFVRQLLCTVFGKSQQEAIEFAEQFGETNEAPAVPIRLRSPRRCWRRRSSISMRPDTIC